MTWVRVLLDPPIAETAVPVVLLAALGLAKGAGRLLGLPGRLRRRARARRAERQQVEALEWSLLD